MESEDTEITLGLGRMVGLFFLLAAICGVFFSIGYSLGKSTAREQALNDPPSQVQAAAPENAASPAPAEEKPAAAVASKPDAAQPAPEQSGTSSQSNLTFYKAVQHGDTALTPAADVTPAAAPKAPLVEKAAAAASVDNTPQAGAAAGRNAVPPVSRSTPVTGPGTIVVQIAAISREDDAVALAGALRKKDYNVIVVKNPAVNDRFYHVQVGPFSNLKEAEAMKTKLVAEGYNPIVKK